MPNPIETWKAEKHSFDVWPDVIRYASAATPMKNIDQADLERMKWHGFFYRKRDEPGRYMNRIRITAGELSAEQAREIAFIAYEWGHGIVDITTRANVQVQGLDIVHLPQVAERLQRVGLSSKQTGHDNIRNVFAHPFSGLMPDELIDTRELCRRVTEVFVDSREFSDLPRKLNICLNGTDRHSAHFWTQDMSFLACRHEGRVLFQLLIGGTQGQNPRLAWHLPVLVEPEQVTEVTRSLIELFRVKGSREKRNRARFRFLIEDIGIHGVLDWLENDLPFKLVPCVTEPVPSGQHDELIGWFPQVQPGLWTLGLCVPLGRLTWRQLEGLAVLSQRWGSGNLRTTHEQGVAVIDVPSGFKAAVATEAAALGLTHLADPLAQNTVACTGAQFCNIAVTETKGQMFQLIERLRRKALVLHGIRIHMSGCPSSCAQHFTADIGLKGVRVRRLLGTREGFDVYLGGGIAGQVHLGLPYKLGVDADQLPQLIENVVQDFYLHHRAGQTFSAYWREKLQAREADKAQEGDYAVPVWVCEQCDFHIFAEDPPVFCPRCSALRKAFVRIEDGSLGKATAAEDESPSVPERSDGFVYAAKLDDLIEGQGREVTVAGKELALFRTGETINAIDNLCPHEGAPLSEGDFKDGVVSCPWHNWTFNTCTGCSLDPPDNPVTRFETLIDDGNVFVKPGAPAESPPAAPPKSVKPIVATLRVLDVIQETPDVRTFRLDNHSEKVPFDFPGKFAKVCIDDGEGELWRSFTISSSPTQPDVLDLTIKLNPGGRMTRYLFDNVSTGSQLTIKGAQGGYYFDPQRHPEPLVLISAGSGITPMMSISRYLQAVNDPRPCTFLYGARTEADVIFREECLGLDAERDGFRYFVTLSRPSDDWTGAAGRMEFDLVKDQIPDRSGSRYFLCGPNEFMESFQAALAAAGVPPERIHTEQFHSSPLVKSS